MCTNDQHSGIKEKMNHHMVLGDTETQFWVKKKVILTQFTFTFSILAVLIISVTMLWCKVVTFMFQSGSRQLKWGHFDLSKKIFCMRFMALTVLPHLPGDYGEITIALPVMEKLWNLIFFSKNPRIVLTGKIILCICDVIRWCLRLGNVRIIVCYEVLLHLYIFFYCTNVAVSYLKLLYIQYL